MKTTIGKRVSALFLCLIAVGPLLAAQKPVTIHIRVLDGKSGLPAAVSNFLVRADRHQTIHNEWVHRGEDGTATVTIPTSVQEIAVKTTDSLSIDTYINCEIGRENDRERDVWYSVAEILQSGVVARNECGKTQFKAKPGELLFFVRARTWREREF